ncbi:MAG: tRNA preQ1(34) S-adenosylmethionine ribosyltransferase-isomerase QueA [Patescibacteria group bacterium]
MSQTNYRGLEFDLPTELIAQSPAVPRDSAKLLVYDRGQQSITHDIFSNIAAYLQPETSLVMNNTKVDHCRWLFDENKIEIFVLEKLDDHRVVAMVRPGKRFKLGQTTQLTESISARTLAINEDGHRTLELSLPHDHPELLAHEHVPLPPYITQNDELAEEYQTVYAKHSGSKAAPTAGLHFTKDLLAEIGESNELIELELEVGLGTFAPLTDENFESQTLHKERYNVDASAAKSLNQSRHITAVGTTSLRTLESITFDGSAKFGDTDIFIMPGYEFRNVDSLITNFHLPGTSLLLLVEAFIGDRAETERIYQEAISRSYRFYSFGDAMLIL